MNFHFLSLLKASNKYFYFLLLIIITAISVEKFWPLNLLNHFYEYYIFSLAIFFIIFAYVKDKIKILITTLFIFAIAWKNNSHPINFNVAKEMNIKIFYQNIHSGNDKIKDLSINILKQSPDVIALVETTVESEWELDKVFYMYEKIASYPRNDNYGFSIYTKKKATFVEIKEIGGIPIWVKIKLGQKDIVVVHLPPPIFRDLWEIQKQSVSEINKIWNHSKDIIVFGDFNTTENGFIYKNLLNEVKPKYFQEKIFFNGTWPSFLPNFLQLSIDHVFSNRPFLFETLPSNGSDHKAFLINTN